MIPSQCTIIISGFPLRPRLRRDFEGLIRPSPKTHYIRFMEGLIEQVPPLAQW